MSALGVPRSAPDSPRTHLSSGLRCPVGRDACGRALGFSLSLRPRAWLPHAPRSLARCCLPTQVCAFLPLGFLVGMRLLSGLLSRGTATRGC